jgi:hypothetical protein
MYLGQVKLGDSISFSVNTHTPSTGAAVDADAVPTYRVYEDETAGPLLTGSMALLDDANTTGFYSEQIAVTTGNGFEVGKCYTVRITGVVGGVTGVELHTFMVDSSRVSDVKTDTAAILADTGTDGVVLATDSITAAAIAASGSAEITDAVWGEDLPDVYVPGDAGYILGNLGASVTMTSPVTDAGDMEVCAGDDYDDDESRSFEWTDSGSTWPTLTGATITLYVRAPNGLKMSQAGTVIVAVGAGKKVRVELTAAQTAALIDFPSPSQYRVRATLPTGHKVTLVAGDVVIKYDLA